MLDLSMEIKKKIQFIDLNLYSLQDIDPLKN